MLMSFFRSLRHRCTELTVVTFSRPTSGQALSALCLAALVSAPVAAAVVLPSASVNKALQAHKINNEALSVAAIPLTSTDRSAYMNADVLVNPASTMKLVTTYAALELLGPAYQWKTEFLTDGDRKSTR